MSEHDKKAAAEHDPSTSARIASLVAQLWSLEMLRQLSVSPDPLFLMVQFEGRLSKAAERGKGLGHAEVLKLLAATEDHLRMCKARLQRRNREDGLWRELRDLLQQRGR